MFLVFYVGCAFSPCLLRGAFPAIFIPEDIAAQTDRSKFESKKGVELTNKVRQVVKKVSVSLGFHAVVRRVLRFPRAAGVEVLA